MIFPDFMKNKGGPLLIIPKCTFLGSVLAAYISFGIDASHLLSASVMSAPAALAFAKLFYPETKKSKTTAESLPKLQSK